MRAVVAERHGGPEVLAVLGRPEPEVGPEQLLVRLAVAGVNFKDLNEREGRTALRAPLVPGSEGVGTVVATGGRVTRFAPGDRVAWCAAPGSYAERVLVPERAAVAVPAGVTDEQAAAVLLQGLTAHYLTESTYPAGAGETALVHAAAGGLGQHLVRLLAARGVRVIGTVSSQDKADTARAVGAQHVVVRRPGRAGDELTSEVNELTDHHGVDVVFDPVGRDTFDAGVAALRRRGTFVLVGAASGPVPPLDPQALAPLGSLFLTRPTLADHTADPAELAARAADVFRWLRDGTLAVSVSGRYRFDQAAQAHADLQGGRTTGKLLLYPTG
ncbi:quinone oxidoreductase [Streptacidiphilus sp. P02-A3a]|uniref:quinone oxidoreductase family protein n=1 Tax=Streptacidiphilus sp. P02-A3a TaxID=2704468 RepID=UPI0015F7A961|nr:quinone oxidoreductase [Streptacidiphilus sp. P02-A3a]QMU71253.1 quinone oxidoreductase [Streptacidiphilus sp. P02-A3a]